MPSRCLLLTVIISGSDKTKTVRLQEAAHWKASNIFSTYVYTCTRRGASVTALLHSELVPIEKQFQPTQRKTKNVLNRSDGSDEPAICGGSLKAHSHMPCRAPALLQQLRVLRESPHGSRKYPNC